MEKEENKTSYVQFDEMETYEHTKCRPLSIALAIRAKTRFIIDAKVALMRCKGRLAAVSRFKYPYWDKDNRKEINASVLQSVKKVATEQVIITSDAKRAYKRLIKANVPQAELVQYKSRKKKSKKDRDPLFSLNHVCAKISADMARMKRRTWSGTKKWQNLQKHLYIAVNNKYDLNLNFC